MTWSLKAAAPAALQLLHMAALTSCSSNLLRGCSQLQDLLLLLLPPQPPLLLLLCT